jgi:hypothetical protein
VAQILIKLDEADNPEYYGLWGQHNELKKRWNELNNQIHEIRVPKLIIWRARKKLNKIGFELAKLQKDYTDWRKRAVNFQMNPHYKITRNENASIVYLHATQNMRNLTDILESNMILIVNNYNSLHVWLNNQFNFLVAVGSFILALAALVISLIPLVGQGCPHP